MHNSIPRKTCSRCKRSKPTSEFNRDKKTSDQLWSWCKSCLKEYRRAWEEKHKKERKEYFKQWHLDNLDRRKKERSKRESKRWKNDPDFRDRKAINKRASIDRKYNTDPTWVEKYRSWARQHTQKRRGLQAQNGGSHTQKEWKELCEKYGNRCLCCGQRKKLTLDHIVPATLGGPDSIDNIQPLCQICNSRKSNRTIDYRPDKKGGR